MGQAHISEPGFADWGSGLVYAFEYLNENLDWLKDQLGEEEDDYYIMDCPGQIELYSHLPVMRNLVQQLQRWGFMVCAVYVLDSQFMADAAKCMSGCLACLSAMVQLEVPHVNVLTKMDLVRKKKAFMERSVPTAPAARAASAAPPTRTPRPADSSTPTSMSLWETSTRRQTRACASQPYLPRTHTPAASVPLPPAPSIPLASPAADVCVAPAPSASEAAAPGAN